ncbi:MAG: radical SAM protein [Clostridiales Family XIII bacterium]|nr:radical SAM protein [Clostridiales Family XIII bacterium]
MLNTAFHDSRAIRVAGISNDSIVDGPGLRMTIFMQGCDKDCAGCHNPEARTLTGGSDFTEVALFEKIRSNPLLTGVTFSGGEPLLQAKALIPLAERIAEAKLSLAIYTGDAAEDIFARSDAEVLKLLSLADIIVDGPFILAKRSLALPFRGSANQRILDAKRSLELGRPVISADPAWVGGDCVG